MLDLTEMGDDFITLSVTQVSSVLGLSRTYSMMMGIKSSSQNAMPSFLVVAPGSQASQPSVPYRFRANQASGNKKTSCAIPYVRRLAKLVAALDLEATFPHVVKSFSCMTDQRKRQMPD